MIQGSVPEARNDINLLDTALTDPEGHYGFSITPVLNATSATMLSSLKTQAALVGPGGTLFVYIGAHGSPDGGAQMNDGQLVYYRQIHDALASTLTTPVKRLVFVIFSCYSGSWINNIDRTDGNPAHVSEMDADLAFDELSADAGVLYEQLVVITSSSAGELSYYTPGGTSHMVQAFSNTFSSLHHQSATPTVGNLIQGIRGSVSSSTVASRVSPPELMSEALYNAPSGH